MHLKLPRVFIQTGAVLADALRNNNLKYQVKCFYPGYDINEEVSHLITVLDALL